MSENPILKFKSWWQEVSATPGLLYPGAICVSTLDVNGFPSGRFVDLKAVDADGFIFCTYLDSQKGQDIKRNPKISLTAWWEGLGYQVRINGIAYPISEVVAETYWQTRSKEAQITTLSSRQSQPLLSESVLQQQFDECRQRIGDSAVPKPDNWGGYRVAPESIEFLTFRENRLHLRELFQLEGKGWQKRLLQP